MIFLNADRIIKATALGFIIFCSLAVLTATIVSGMNASFAGVFAYDLSRTIELVRLNDVNTVTFDDLTRFKNKAEFGKISGYSETVSVASNKFGVYESGIKAVLVDAEYTSIYKSDMLLGNFPDTQAISRGEAYAVISDQLAVKLFKTKDIVGNEINILGHKYIVTGVYKSKGSILWNLCGDGFDRIFIPYCSIENYKEMPVDVITLFEKPGHSITDTKAILDTELGNSLFFYKIIDHSISGIVFHQYYDLLIFVIGALAALFTLIFFVKYSINTIRHFKEKSDSYYIFEILKVEAKRIAYYLSILLLCCVGFIFIANTIRFSFVITDEYIPYDNIFDAQFYLKAVFNNILVTNFQTYRTYSILEHTYNNALQIELFFTFVIVIFIIVALMFFKLLVLLDISLLRILKLILITVFVNGILGMLISVLLGFGLFLPIKDWLIILYFLVILLCMYSKFAVQNKE